jgi:hypothetical protein
VLTPIAAPTYLDRVLAAVARRVLRRPSVRLELGLEVGPVRREGDAVYVPSADGGWRMMATASGETTAPLWRPAPFWTRQREPPSSPWARVAPPPESPGFRRLPR